MKQLHTECKSGSWTNSRRVTGKTGAESSRSGAGVLIEPLAFHPSPPLCRDKAPGERVWLWLACTEEKCMRQIYTLRNCRGGVLPKEKWLAGCFVCEKSDRLAPKTGLGNPSCRPIVVFTDRALYHRAPLSASHERWTWSRGKSSAFTITSFVSFFPPEKWRGAVWQLPCL